MKKLHTLLMSLCTLFAIHSTPAQSSWSQLASLPNGASVLDMATDSSNTVYVLTYYLSEIYYTTNNGLNWTKIPGTFDFWNVDDIEVDKTNGTLYVGTLENGLYWTANKGLTWSFEYFYTNSNSGFHATIQKLVKKPNSSVIIGCEPGSIYPAPATIYRSVNGGISWSNNLANFDEIADLKYMANGTLLAGTENGVCKSANDGLNWSLSNTGITKMRVTSILEKTSSSKIFAAVDFNFNLNDTIGAGIYVSTNGGSSWTRTSTGLTDLQVNCLALDSSSGDIYATSYTNVYRSVNDGQSWTLVNSGLNSDDFTCIAATSNGVFCGNKKAGVSFCSFPFASWTDRNNDLSASTITSMALSANANVHVLDGANTGVYNLSNGTWNHLNAGLPSASGQNMVQDSNGVLYASFIGKNPILYKSVNQGLSWTGITTLPMPNGLKWAECTVLKVDRNNDLFVVLHTVTIPSTPDKVLRSPDGGLTWTNLYTLNTNSFVAINDIDVAGDSTIYLSLTDVTTAGAILYSVDWGNSFSTLTNPVSNVSYQSDLVIAPNDSLYIQQLNHIYTLSSGGNLTQLPDGAWGSSYTNALELFIDKLNTLYVTSREYGIFTSTTGGNSWTDISNGLPVYSPPLSNPVILSIDALQFDNNQVPYALSLDHYSGALRGIYRYAAITNTTTTGPANGLLSIKEGQNKISVYPNPTTGMSSISYTGLDLATTSMQVFNSTGSLVESLDLSKWIRNTKISLDLSGQPSGLYFLKVITKETMSSLKIIRE